MDGQTIVHCFLLLKQVSLMKSPRYIIAKKTV
jgi:hypothetical protein